MQSHSVAQGHFEVSEDHLNQCVQPVEQLLVAWHWLPNGKQIPPPSWLDVLVSFCQTIQCNTYAGILHSSAAFNYLLSVTTANVCSTAVPTENLGLGAFIKRMAFYDPTQEIAIVRDIMFICLSDPDENDRSGNPLRNFIKSDFTH